MINNELKRPIEDLLSDAGPESEAEQDVRGQLLVRLIVGQTIAVVFLTIMTAIGGLLMPGSDLLALLPLGAIAAVVGLVSYWLLRRNQFRLAGYLFLIGTSVAITVNVSIRGYQDASAIYYLWPILGAVAVLETRGGVLIAAISTASYTALVAVQQLGYQTPPLLYDPQREALLTVGSRVIMFFLLAFLAWLSTQNLNRALRRTRLAAWRWRDLNETLEQRVADRTRDLEHRSMQLEAAAEVARDATTTRKLDDLLSRAVSLIRDRFGFYHAGIFLVDERSEYAVLRAATGEAGRQMLEQGHRLKVGEVGIVGHVIASGQPRIVLDVGADAVHFENPLLPETRSEMALPLWVGKQVIGALNVQSREEAAFDDDDVAVLQTMADQLAVAIENARLLHEMQQTVRELEVTTGQYTQESWETVIRGLDQPLGYRYRHLDVEPVTEQPPEVRQAWEQGRLVITTSQSGAGGDEQETTSTLAVPVAFRGQVVGVLNLRFEGETVATETVSMIEEVANRLGLALEGARLHQETQRRAARDRLVSEVADKMRRATDMDSLLQTTIQEMAAVLGTPSTFVQLSTPPGPTADDDKGKRPPAA